MFIDRKDAGQKLAQELKKLNVKNGIILALPRGGVIIGSEISKILNLPLDIIVTRKIGALFDPEYAIAAVSENEIVLNPEVTVDKKYLVDNAKKERQEIKRRLKAYRKNIKYPELKGKTVILVDDGLATGLSMEAAVLEVKYQKPQKIIVAVPVAPPETVEKLRKRVSKVIVLKIEQVFFSIGQFYDFFPQITDLEVKKLLD